MNPNNSFSIVGYQGPEYFCDREKETKKLLSWIEGEGLHSTVQVDAVVADLIEDRSLTFRDLLDSQNEVAKKLLPAIAKAGGGRTEFSGIPVGLCVERVFGAFVSGESAREGSGLQDRLRLRRV